MKTLSDLIEKFGAERVVKLARHHCSGMLPSLHLSVTDHCFNRCPMCGHWKRKELHQADLPRLIRFLQLAKDHLRLETVGLTGGDPMAHPELDVLLRWLIRNDVRFGIVTAGYVPEEKSTAQLQRAKWVRVSLDAVDEKIYSKTRGGHITFSQVEDSLIRMMKAGVNVQFGITINEINSLHLPDILRKIWTWKLNYRSISEVMVRAVCHHSDRLKAQQLPDSQEIEELASQLKDIGVSCDIELTRETLMPIERCYATVYQLYPAADGYVYPCCMTAADSEAEPHCDPLFHISEINTDNLHRLAQLRSLWSTIPPEALPRICAKDCPTRLNVLNVCYPILSGCKNFY